MTTFICKIVFENYQVLCETDSHTHCMSDVTVLHLANPLMSQTPVFPALTYCPRGTLVPTFFLSLLSPCARRDGGRSC